MGINLSIFYKIRSDHLHTDPKLYTKYKNPSSSGSLDILTIYFYNYNDKVCITLSIFYGVRSKVNQVVYTLILHCMQNIRIIACAVF